MSKKRFFSKQVFDKPIAENGSFRCVASLGSIVPGWVLIIPKKPVLNLSMLDLTERRELHRFSVEIAKEIEIEYGFSTMFEHGPSSVGSVAGCGVDQAHLHIVPLSSNELKSAPSMNSNSWEKLEGSWADLNVTFGREYLWFSDAQSSWITYPKSMTSQFFRKCVAEIVGIPDEWDYNLNPFHGNITETQKIVGARLRERELVV
ncbi:HIT family protein [Parasphingorhabdus sp.]|uniref:HIT family protein n=1 Tax=Parasphingorhabdus sp. TaxID=2709688 RepID=UPI003A918FA2